MPKEIIFFLTHKMNPVILNNIHKINRERGGRDFCILIHGKQSALELPVPVYHFSIDQLRNQEYNMLDENSMFSSVHLALLYYFNHFPSYVRYWFLEYDVEFGGCWQNLFDTYVDSSADFISSYVQYNNKKEYWPWWDLQHPQKSIPFTERIRSFNPIYRISKRALEFLSTELKTGWKGHHEVLLPTLLHAHKFKLLDFAGEGMFYDSIYPDYYKRNAHFPSLDSQFLRLGTLRYRPAMKKAGNKDLIYHPVKMDSGLSRVEEVLFQFSLFTRKVSNYVWKVIGMNRYQS